MTVVSCGDRACAITTRAEALSGATDKAETVFCIVRVIIPLAGTASAAPPSGKPSHGTTTPLQDIQASLAALDEMFTREVYCVR